MRRVLVRVLPSEGRDDKFKVCHALGADVASIRGSSVEMELELEQVAHLLLYMELL